MLGSGLINRLIFKNTGLKLRYISCTPRYYYVRNLIATILLVFNICTVFAQSLNKENQKIVADFISNVRSGNREKLCDSIFFPFRRRYPIPDIKNREEFLRRYSEIFDDSLTKMILNSDPAKDWSEMGWRGIMLFNGELWLDSDGWLTGVNYQSNFEIGEYKRLIKIEKGNLYESIKKFETPVCILETSRYRIRIDDMGDWHYRYVSWPLKSKMSDKPDVIIENGQSEPEGTGGNEKFTFKNAGYVYECFIINMGEDGSPPAKLTIFKGDKAILSESANMLRN